MEVKKSDESATELYLADSREDEPLRNYLESWCKETFKTYCVAETEYDVDVAEEKETT